MKKEKDNILKPSIRRKRSNEKEIYSNQYLQKNVLKSFKLLHKDQEKIKKQMKTKINIKIKIIMMGKFC